MESKKHIDRLNMKPELREEVERFVAERGGHEAYIQEMREFEEACIRMNDEYDSLLERFPNKWVAMNHEGSLFVGNTLEGLLAEFKSQGLDSDGYNIKFLDPDPGILIL